MKRVATITFHGSHNYGSTLQAYALQVFVTELCLVYGQELDYSILNLRTTAQKEIYMITKPIISIKNVVKNIMTILYSKQLTAKYYKFENFISSNLRITNETYDNEKELAEANLDYDYYISGSDQIWNVRATDFLWSNFLSFVRKGKKLSYAASFGPLYINWELYDKDKCSNLLNFYDIISVREVGSHDQVNELTGKESEIHVDPTLLLTKGKWLELFGDKKYVESKYIFFYSLEPSSNDIRLVKQFSKKLGLPVVVSKYSNRKDFFNPFIKKYASGPIEFLNLINNAELVLSTSFHGTVFSLLFNVPFFAINGLADNRIGSLLKNVKLEERSLSYNDWESKVQRVFDIDFNYPNKVIELERKRSSSYLEKALDLK